MQITTWNKGKSIYGPIVGDGAEIAGVKFFTELITM